jgi:hypothetical protein
MWSAPSPRGGGAVARQDLAEQVAEIRGHRPITTPAAPDRIEARPAAGDAAAAHAGARRFHASGLSRPPTPTTAAQPPAPSARGRSG